MIQRGPSNRGSARKGLALDRFEPCEGKLSRTVLRGAWAGQPPAPTQHMDTPPKFEHGTVSSNVTVECVTIRVMSDSDDPNQEMRLQGRLKNVSPYALDDVKCDLSYFSAEGTFLGLDMTSFTQLDDIEIGESVPFDLELKMPVETVRCVFNVHAKRVLQDIGVALQGYVSSKKSRP